MLGNVPDLSNPSRVSSLLRLRQGSIGPGLFSIRLSNSASLLYQNVRMRLSCNDILGRPTQPRAHEISWLSLALQENHLTHLRFAGSWHLVDYSEGGVPSSCRIISRGYFFHQTLVIELRILKVYLRPGLRSLCPDLSALGM